jgi:hypothetical protein
MGRRRRIALIVLAAASLMLATGSSAFTSTSADREISIEVVEDDEAYLGQTWHELDRCGNQDLVTIENRFGTELTEVDVIIVDSEHINPVIKSEPEKIGAGDAATIKINPRSPENASQDIERTVTVKIEAKGPAFVETGQKTLDVNCPSDDD